MSRIASLTATPASTIMPSISITPTGRPRGTRTTATPISASGTAETTVSGWISDSNVPASTMNTSSSASRPAKRSSEKVRTRSASSPATRVRRPGGRSVAPSACSAAAIASGNSLPSATLAVTRATLR